MTASSAARWRWPNAPEFTGMLPEIDVPALVVARFEVSLYAVQVARYMVEQIPNADLAIIPGNSHAAVFEAPCFLGSNPRLTSSPLWPQERP